MGKEEARELFTAELMDAWKAGYQTDAERPRKEAFQFCV